MKGSATRTDRVFSNRERRLDLGALAGGLYLCKMLLLICLVNHLVCDVARGVFVYWSAIAMGDERSHLRARRFRQMTRPGISGRRLTHLAETGDARRSRHRFGATCYPASFCLLRLKRSMETRCSAEAYSNWSNVIRSKRRIQRNRCAGSIYQSASAYDPAAPFSNHLIGRKV